MISAATGARPRMLSLPHIELNNKISNKHVGKVIENKLSTAKGAGLMMCLLDPKISPSAVYRSVQTLT